jgi:hypothetical protein
MLVRFIPSVDCTADPHWISFSEKDRAEIADLILKVCESNVVWRISSVRVSLDETDEGEVYSGYMSDSSWSDSDGKEALRGTEAERNKTAGLFMNDAKDANIPPGLEGVRKAIKFIKGLKANKPFYLSIGVYWDEFQDHNCSDYIQWPPEEGGSGQYDTVNFENQDWYIPGDNASDEDVKKYYSHLRRLGKVIGCAVEPSAEAKSGEDDE